MPDVTFGAHTWGGKGLISTYKDHKISFLPSGSQTQVVLPAIHSSWVWFLKVSATFRTTVDDVELCFLVACLAQGVLAKQGGTSGVVWHLPVFPVTVPALYWRVLLTQFVPLPSPHPAPLTGLVLGC